MERAKGFGRWGKAPDFSPEKGGGGAKGGAESGAGFDPAGDPGCTMMRSLGGVKMTPRRHPKLTRPAALGG